jgi:hypothetical protein
VASVSEDLADHPEYVTGPALCEVVQPDGDVFFFPRISASFTIDVGPEDIVTCALKNNFVYEPGINLEKVASEDVVRGDLGGTPVTYTYTVTNTGNTPLVLTAGGDPDCADIEFIGGDANDDGRLDLSETWTFECTKTLVAGLIQDEIVVPNEATVTGVAPNGDSDTDTANETVQVIVPFINLEKVPSETLVAPGTEVTYTFTVTNLGNVPLTDVTLTDDQCGEPDFIDGDTNGDTSLDLDEIWIYECAAEIVEDPTVNQAEVTGTPPEGEDVSDPADAKVDVVYEDMNLSKEVSSNLAFVGDNVTYTYVVSNPAADDLAPIAPTTRADLVTDDSCEPVNFVDGDVGDDEILSEGEAWTYTCTTTDGITATTLNTATATMQGPLAPITRTNEALVIPLPAGIEIIKTASDDLVPAGTDVTYTYEVINTG